MLGGVEGSILDTYGGEYEWDKWQVILHSSRGQVRDFSVRYGVNMLTYNEEYDASNCYSACIPYWTDGTITIVGNKQTNSGVTPSGREQCIPLDVSDKFEAQPTKAQVNATGLSVMNGENPTVPAQNIEVSFVRLQDMGEYELYENLLQCGLCDTITVVFPDFNSSGQFKIVKTVWNVLKGKFDSMELGNLSTTLSEALGLGEKSGGGGVKIQRGVVQIGTVATHDIGEVLVTFDEPFQATPVVVAGLYSGSSGYGMGSVSVGVRGISSTGFYARVFNNDSVARIPDVEWIAIL